MGKDEKTLTRRQVRSKLAAIARRIRESGAVKNAIKVAKQYGDETTKVGNSNTHKIYDYTDSRLMISYQTGRNMFGHASLDIYYGRDGKGRVEVLQAVNNSHENSVGIRVRGEQISRLYVLTYHPGKWEAELKRIVERGPPKKGKKRKGPEKVSKEEMATLRHSFGNLI